MAASEIRSGRPAPVNSPVEMWAWLFMRASGVVLLFLAIGHLVIMHVINNIDNIDYQFVVQRWETPFWRTYDGIMLVLALVHGMNGLRTIMEDYLRPGGVRTFCLSLLGIVFFVFLIIGLATILTFQPK